MKLLICCILFLQTAFVWDNNHQLKWSDFEGKYVDSSVSASTCTELYMDTKGDLKGGLVFNIEARFHPEKSFVSPTCSMSDYVLKHEQTHFDITEMYARKLRLLVKHFQRTTHKDDYDMVVYFYNHIVEQWAHTEHQYDLETDNGDNVPIQKKWELIVQSDIRKSTLYADKPITSFP